MENKLLNLAKKFVARVEASPSTWQSGYPELAQEFRVAIKAAEQSANPTRRSVAQKVSSKSKKVAKPARG